MNDTETIAERLTHHVRLVLDNSEDSYRRRREIVRGFLSGPDSQYPHLLGDQLKDWCEDMAGVSDGSLDLLAQEVLTTALAFVNWREMAEDYIEEEREQD